MPDIKRTFQMEYAQNVRQEIEPLLLESWSTVEASYPQSRLNPNFGFYLAAQESGVLRVFTSREGEVLVGYALVYVIQHPHRSDDLVASIEVLFIRKHARAGDHAAKFLEHIEDQIRLLGAVSLVVGSRNKIYDRWLSMRGFHMAEKVWERSLAWRH